MAKRTDRPIRDPRLADEDVGLSDDNKLLKVARDRYEKAIDYDTDNRRDGIEDLEFQAGGRNQWPNEVIQERLDDQRPILTINRMPTFIRQITGNIRQNKPGIKVRPVDDAADEEVADVFTGLIRHIESVSQARVAYRTASDGQVACGIGHFRIVTEYSEDDMFEQDIRIERVTDPFAVTWDPQAIKLTMEDARYAFVEESLDRETFRARYPKASLWDFDFEEKSDHTFLSDWVTRDVVKVAEYWTKEYQERLLAQLVDGKVLDITDMESEDGVYYDAAGNFLDIEQTRKAHRPRIEMRMINGAEVLEGPISWAGKYIPIVPVVGEEIFIGQKRVRYGVIRNAKDPQRMYNFWATSQTEMVALQPKAPWQVTPKQVRGFEEYYRESNRRNIPYLPFNPDSDSPGPPVRVAPPVSSQGMATERLAAADDMKATTGIFDAALGNRSNETSGIAIQRRQMESDVGNYQYADNLSIAIEYCGVILVDLIPQIYDTERYVRIVNPDDTTEMVAINQLVRDKDGREVLLNDLSVGKYDVNVSSGPSYTTRRLEAVDSMLAFAQAVPGAAQYIIDLIAKNSDWPGADEIAERLRKLLPPGMAEQEPEEDMSPEQLQQLRQQQQQQQLLQQIQQQLQQAEMAEKAAKVEKAMGDAKKAHATAGKLAAETEGQELENQQSMLELSEQTGQLEQLVSRAVGEALINIVQGMQGGGAPQMNGGAPQMPAGSNGLLGTPEPITAEALPPALSGQGF